MPCTFSFLFRRNTWSFLPSPCVVGRPNSSPEVCVYSAPALETERLAREEREKRLAEKREKQIALQEEAAQRNHKELARWEEGRKQQEARAEERLALMPPPTPELPEPATPFTTQLGVLAGAF